MLDFEPGSRLHIGAHLQSGKLFTRSEPITAGSDYFTATVQLTEQPL